jgi:hypothetical protein
VDDENDDDDDDGDKEEDDDDDDGGVPAVVMAAAEARRDTGTGARCEMRKALPAAEARRKGLAVCAAFTTEAWWAAAAA